MRRRPDVGMRNDHLFGSGSDCYHADSFAPECGFARASMACVEQNRRPAT
jgi:hypothetical protein